MPRKHKSRRSVSRHRGVSGGGWFSSSSPPDLLLKLLMELNLKGVARDAQTRMHALRSFVKQELESNSEVDAQLVRNFSSRMEKVDKTLMALLDEAKSLKNEAHVLKNEYDHPTKQTGRR